MLNTLIFEVVNVTYIYLGGSPVTAGHIFRAFLNVVLTGMLAMVLMFPLRRLIFGRRIDAPVMKTAPVTFSKH